MNRILRAAALAALTTAASWAVRRWLDRRYAPRPIRGHVDDWENEGGALAPHYAGQETSQVPR